MPKVSVTHCDSYEAELIRTSLIRNLDNLGGISRFIQAGDKVLIKPNLIAPKPVRQPAQTNPILIWQMVKIAIAAGAKVTVADSPAWSNTLNCLRAMDIDRQIMEAGAVIKDLNDAQPVILANTGIKIGISRIAIEADKIINLPKLKAHQQMTATIAVKNMFGTVPGKSKALWHYRKGGTVAEFAAMILDIYNYLKPVVNIVDAVTAMQGQGPINGSAKHIGLLLASEDAIALERVCAKILDLDDDSLPIIKASKSLSEKWGAFEDIEIEGDDFSQKICLDFQNAELMPLKFSLPRVCKSAAKQLMLLVKNKVG